MLRAEAASAVFLLVPVAGTPRALARAGRSRGTPASCGSIVAFGAEVVDGRRARSCRPGDPQVALLARAEHPAADRPRF